MKVRDLIQALEELQEQTRHATIHSPEVLIRVLDGDVYHSETCTLTADGRNIYINTYTGD